MKFFRIIFCLLSLSLLSLSQTRIPDLPAITGSAVDPATDLLWINDTSAGTSGSKKIALAELVNIPGFFGNVSATELGYLDGVTSSIQTQLNAKQAALGFTPADSAKFVAGAGTLTGPAANLTLGTAAGAATGDFAPASHTQAASTISDSTAAGRALLTAEDAAAQRASLGIPESMISVSDYAPDITGVADCTAAIQSAISAAQSAGKVLYFPAGIYKCNLTIAGNIHIVGSGNGSVGDWGAVEAPGRTRLIPNNNALPVVLVSELKGITLEKLEIRGNGAGTSVYGIQIDHPFNNFAGNGLIVRDCIVRRCTYGFQSIGGCNVAFEYSGIFECNFAIHIPNPPFFAHSYLFKLCSMGGNPATGTGRIFHVEENSFLTFIQCELGNCEDFGYMGVGNPSLVIIGGNWETYNSPHLIEMLSGQISWQGGRLSTTGKTLVKAHVGSVTGISFDGLQLIGAQRVVQCNGALEVTVNGCGALATIAEYSADFSTLVGESTTRPLVVSARLAGAGQLLTGAVTNTIVFNTVSVNVGGKYSTSTGKFIPGKRGYYNVSVNARTDTGVVGSYLKAKVFINGGSYATIAALTAGGAGTSLSGSGIFYMDANDELDLRVETGGTIQVGNFDNYTTQLFIQEVKL